MPLFDWSNDYSVRNQGIDQQHQQLFHIINELYDAIEADKGATVVGNTIQSLIDYTRNHFAAEEQLMLAKGYPDYLAHKAIHDELLAQVDDFDRRYREGETAVVEDILPFLLGDWLMNHITVMDQQYAPYLER